MKVFEWIIAMICIATGFAKVEHQEYKPITIVTCSYNNREYYRKNLDSLLKQEYPNYRVIYIDDCSPDGTGEAVEEYLKDHPNAHKVQLIRNETRKRAMGNLWYAIHLCKDDEIVVIVDGDDWLPHSKVLDIVEYYYKDPDIWFAYSNYITHPSGRPGLSRPIPDYIWETKGSIRRLTPFCISHLHSFYAGLFKQIQLKDLTFQGDFVMAAYDCAMYYPMIEMARGHVKFMKEKLYIYNQANPINDYRSNRSIQHRIHLHTVKLPPYQPLNFHPAKDSTTKEENAVDLVVFSYNRPMQLYAYLESLYKHVQHLDKVTVIYRADKDEFDKGYQKVIEAFPTVEWQKQKAPPSDFKHMTLNAVFNPNRKAKFIAFAVDDMIVKDKVDLREVVRLLNKTHAYTFQLRLGKNIHRSYMTGKEDKPPITMELEPGVLAWAFDLGGAEWGYANSVDMGIYRKADIQDVFKELDFSSPNFLEGQWARHVMKNRIGLCYELSKIVNLPMNHVSSFKNKNLQACSAKELLTKFMKGAKINIDALYQMVNDSPHINYQPEFISQD